MESFLNYATEQYKAVRSSRQVVFNYCKTISQADLITENSSFARGGSIHNLLVHIANTYQYWIAAQALQKEISFTSYDIKQKLDDIIKLFETVDIYINEFLTAFQFDAVKQINYEIDGKPGSATAFKLFTHVITHEFHHKGQILSISRHLGYIPVDTDIIR